MKSFIPIEEFFGYINSGEIPPLPPIGSSIGGNNYALNLDHYKARDECTSRGMWAIVDKVWTQELAAWVGKRENRKCLEVMAGAGWLAKALQENGVDIIATDNAAWDKRHSKMNHVASVERISGIGAVKKYQHAGILIVSWPPYGDSAICRICKAWGRERPIVYIGEGEGGCNAPDEFWKNFQHIDDQPNIPLMAWRGLHDYVFIGHYINKDQ